MSIKVIVRDIENDIYAETPEHQDGFVVPGMKPGKTITVAPIEGKPGWYYSIGKHTYNYHKSWLIFPSKIALVWRKNTRKYVE